MKMNWTTLLVFMTSYVPFAHASSEPTKSPSTAMLIALGISLAALAYAGNKWRSWYVGFQVGDASGSEFFSALKWSTIGAMVTVTSLWIALQFK
jgi:hypothetical protein